MKTLLATLCACLALGLVVAGCGGDDDGDDSGAAPATTKEQPADTGGGDTSGGAAADAASVSMKDIAFTPAEVTVPKGGSVTWTNDDSVGHDVTKESGPGPDFKSGEPGAMSAGDTFTHKFDVPGTVKYVCTVHPGMDGSVVVGK